MFIAYNGDKIVEVDNDRDRIEDLCSECKIIEGDLFSDKQRMLSLARVYKDKIVLLPTVIISLSKKSIKCNGEDTITISLSISDLQPEEDVDKLTLKVNDAEIPIDMTGGKGEISLSCQVPGIYVVSIEDTGFLCSKRLLEARK